MLATEEGGAGRCWLPVRTPRPACSGLVGFTICFTDTRLDRELDLWLGNLGFSAHLVPANGGIN